MAITKVTNAVLSSGSTLSILDGKSFLDEDNMASNSATGIASQQSIKAYVDSQSGSTTLLGLTDVGSDGTNGQVLTTNGSGGFTFTTVSGGSSTPSIDDQGTGTTALTIYSSGQSAFAADVQVTGSIYVSGTVDGVDIAARNTVLTSTTTTANAALPKAGGTMTGNLTVNAIVDADNYTINGTQGTDGQVLTSTGSGVAWEDVVGGSPSITDYSNGSTQVFVIYQGGNMDINGTPTFSQDVTFANDILANGYIRATDIRTHNNNNIEIDPNGSGVVIFKGNATKGAGQFKLNCENNSHGITIKGPPHSAGASYTLTLPNDDGSSNQVLTTNGSGVLSWSTPSSGSSYDDAAVNTHLNTSTASNGEVLSWNGSDYDWVAQSGGGSVNGLFATDIFTATSGQTAFTLSNSVSNENNLMVFVDGVFQAQNTYSTSGTTLTFATGIVLNRVVTVYHIETASSGGSSGINVTKVSIASDQNIGRNTTTQLNFDTIEFGNSDSAFNTTTKKYTAPAAGTYQFTGRIVTNTYNTSSGTTISLTGYIYKNNSTLIAMNQDYVKAAGSKRFITFFDDIVELAQGDVIDFRAGMSNYAHTTDATIWTYDVLTHMSIIKH